MADADRLPVDGRAPGGHCRLAPRARPRRGRTRAGGGAIHDYDELPNFGELPDWDELDAYLHELREHVEDGHRPFEALNAYVEYTGSAAGFAEAFIGGFGSCTDLAEFVMDECGDWDNIPERWQMYVDIERFARDLMASDVFEENGFYFCRL